MNIKYAINVGIIRILGVIIALWFGLSDANAQNHIYKVFIKSDWQQYYDSLLQNFGVKKNLVKEFELQSLIALSYYPELKNVPITFRYANIRTTMEVRPEYFSALKNFNRKYVIFISKNIRTEGVLLKDVSFNAQIGVIGHELAHILDYESRTIKSLFGLALNYIIIKNHAKYERSIDKLTITRGLGWQELEFADFMENKSKATQRYKRFKQLNYLNSSEIEREIANLKMYSSFSSLKKSNNSTLTR